MNFSFTLLLRLLVVAALASTPALALAEIPSASDQCAADLEETTPSSDFTPLEDGEVVRHEPTDLEWQRCPNGMQWFDGTCAGSAQASGWIGALRTADEAGDGWRLPDVNELQSIVERCRVSPAVNEEVFPRTPPTIWFWSSSPRSSSPGSAWFVNFDIGRVELASTSLSMTFRLVRDAQ